MMEVMVVLTWKFVFLVITSHLAITGSGVRANENLFTVSTPSLVKVNQTFEIAFWTDFTLFFECYWDFNDNITYTTNATDLQEQLTHKYTQPAAYNIFTNCCMAGQPEAHFSEVLVYSEIYYEICSYRSVNLTYNYDIYILGESDLLIFNHHEFPDPLYYYMELDGYPVFDEVFSHGALQNDDLYAVLLDTLPFPMELQNIVGLGSHNVSVTVYSEINNTAVYCESQIKFVELITGMVFYVSEYFVQTNHPFIGSLAAESGWPALIEWSAYNEDTFELEFYFDSYRQARRPDEVDEVWLFISKPGNYTLRATMYHEINEASEYTTIIVENPITTLDIFLNAPLHYPLEDTLQMYVNYTSDGIPTDIHGDIDYGDGAIGW
ncbi:uncharacterized protein LOC100892682 [Strongylocentrotus purpuratus]|uniref:Uncharacterized protein n=1 Tax=Strongylocentrotus purpuratus TaxID=7668 RepID=A0A7M7PPB4_STRPU|nr:uncharacterized protein LOC100892682 [Strongylocentrotus purpuratus]